MLSFSRCLAPLGCAAGELTIEDLSRVIDHFGAGAGAVIFGGAGIGRRRGVTALARAEQVTADDGAVDRAKFGAEALDIGVKLLFTLDILRFVIAEEHACRDAHSVDGAAQLALAAQAAAKGIPLPADFLTAPCPEPEAFLLPDRTAGFPSCQLDLGGLNLQVIQVPGHTPGSVCYLFKEYNSLFAGDTLFRGSVGRTDLPGGDMESLMRSIKEKLLTLPEDLQVYPGHGYATSIGLEKRENPFL